MLIILAQAGVDPVASWYQPLVNMGAIGIVLGWFMLRAEPRLRAIEASIDRVARALMVAVLSMKSCDASLKEQAQSIINEVEEAHKNQ